MAIIEIHVPDVGGAEGVSVIEILVKVGDSVSLEQGLITLESDKASMDVPSPHAGVIQEILVKVGDKVAEGSLVARIETKTAEAPVAEKTSAQTDYTVAVPSIGGADAVSVIEVLVKPGDVVQKEQGLVTLESDKASMDVPSPVSGTVVSVSVKVGDSVTEGSAVVVIKTAGEAALAPVPVKTTSAPIQASQPPVQKKPVSTAPDTEDYGLGKDVFASPAVRRIAREFGVNLRKVTATGEKGRILIEDVQRFVKTALAATPSSGLGIEPMPVIDFAKFGAIEKQPLNKIKKLTAKFMHRNWLTVPHVTQFDEADITELEAFRVASKADAEKKGVKLTPLVFIMEAVAKSLETFPKFNASLDPSGEELILKKYIHIGVAVDTPQGLVVPVIRDVNRKNLLELARELSEVSAKARDGKLLPGDMQGGCFTISSLGGIGGTAFTPIVNAPEVAILGVSRSSMKPVYIDNAFVPRLMLPLCLSYDHRVIDGADGARFITHLKNGLTDIRRSLL